VSVPYDLQLMRYSALWLFEIHFQPMNFIINSVEQFVVDICRLSRRIIHRSEEDMSASVLRLQSSDRSRLQPSMLLWCVMFDRHACHAVAAIALYTSANGVRCTSKTCGTERLYHATLLSVA